MVPDGDDASRLWPVLVLDMFVVQGIGHVISVGVDPNKSMVLIQNVINGFQHRRRGVVQRMH